MYTNTVTTSMYKCCIEIILVVAFPIAGYLTHTDTGHLFVFCRVLLKIITSLLVV